MNTPVPELHLTVSQFRLLRRVSDGAPVHQRPQAYGMTGQIRTLRHLALLGLVREMPSKAGIRFEITDVGRKLAEPDG
jgi:hypothetical protein